MSYMERRLTFIITCFFLFLLLILPYLSRGEPGSEALMYEIDYRGPETHSSVPPPDHSHGKTRSAQWKSSAEASKKVTGLRGSSGTIEEKVKKVHG